MPTTGPILFAYDGCELAKFAIEEAARLLPTDREALVLTVWQPADVGFLPTTKRSIDATKAVEVKQAASETAAHGAELATNAGFRAESLEIESAPTWKGIVKIADQHDVSMIVLGSHRRTGLVGHLLGSVAAAVVSHSQRSVLVVHKPGESE